MSVHVEHARVGKLIILGQGKYRIKTIRLKQSTEEYGYLVQLVQLIEVSGLQAGVSLGFPVDLLFRRFFLEKLRIGKFVKSVYHGYMLLGKSYIFGVQSFGEEHIFLRRDALADEDIFPLSRFPRNFVSFP